MRDLERRQQIDGMQQIFQSGYASSGRDVQQYAAMGEPRLVLYEDWLDLAHLRSALALAPAQTQDLDERADRVVQSRQAPGAHFDRVLRDVQLITVRDVEQPPVDDALYRVVVEQFAGAWLHLADLHVVAQLQQMSSTDLPHI